MSCTIVIVEPHMCDPDLCQLTVSVFDKLAKKYSDRFFSLSLYDSYLRRFSQLLHSDRPCIIDIACGPGNVSAFFTRERPAAKVTGIDLAPGMIEQARHNVPSGEFLVEDCRHLERLNRMFDAATYSFGLSYLNDRDALQFFGSLNKILRPSAPLYLSTVTGERSQSGMETASSGDQVFMEYRSVDEVVAIVKEAGWHVTFQDLLPSPANAHRTTQDLVLIAMKGGVGSTAEDRDTHGDE